MICATPKRENVQVMMMAIIAPSTANFRLFEKTSVSKKTGSGATK